MFGPESTLSSAEKTDRTDLVTSVQPSIFIETTTSPKSPYPHRPPNQTQQQRNSKSPHKSHLESRPHAHHHPHQQQKQPQHTASFCDPQSSNCKIDFALSKQTSNACFEQEAAPTNEQQSVETLDDDYNDAAPYQNHPNDNQYYNSQQNLLHNNSNYSSSHYDIVRAASLPPKSQTNKHFRHQLKQTQTTSQAANAVSTVSLGRVNELEKLISSKMHIVKEIDLALNDNRERQRSVGSFAARRQESQASVTAKQPPVSIRRASHNSLT